MVADITKKAADKKFDGYAAMLKFINGLLPQDTEDTFLLKDAFPERAGLKARGSLDCDSRALLALAVIEKLSYPLGKIFMADQFSYVVLFYGSEYFDMNLNEVI